MFAKQSTALTLIVGPILDSAGAEYTGAVIGDLSISKNGGTLTALAAAATLTHSANGQYTLVLTTGNTDTLGVIQVTCNKSTYQMPTVERHVIPANVYESLVLGSDSLDVNALTMDSAVVAAIQSGLATSTALTQTDMTVQAAAQSAANAATNTTTILARIGAFTGTGINTILGFLKAIMRSDATVPSDVGGTFASSTDSLQANADAIAAIDVGGGTGARSVTITITDGTDPLENVNVRVTQGIESYVQPTNASGVATFALDDATWTVRAAKAGYTMSNQSLVVNGTETVTYAMTAVALSQPANPALVSHNVLCTGIDGEPEPGAIVYYRATAGTGTAGYSRDTGEATATADADGYATLTFITGVTYAIRRGTIGREVTYVASATTPPETMGAP